MNSEHNKYLKEMPPAHHSQTLYQTTIRNVALFLSCLLYTSPSPRDRQKSRMPSSA